MYLLSQITVKERSFKGIANSGKVFDYQGVPTIVDLSELSFYDKTPILITHDRNKRAGFGTLSIADNQLMIDGKLLDNDFGSEIAKDADAGFPWQMSVHVTPKSVQVLTGDETAVVNGQTVKAPTQILRRGHISEVSFTPTGVDSQTHAHIFSQPPKEQSMTEAEYKLSLAQKDQEISTKDQALADKDKELAQKQATLDEQAKTIDEQAKKIDELTANAHKANVEAKLSAKGFAKDDDGKWAGVPFDVLLSLDDTGASAVIDSLIPKKDAPDFLFSQSTTGQGETNPLLADAEQRAKGA